MRKERVPYNPRKCPKCGETERFRLGPQDWFECGRCGATIYPWRERIVSRTPRHAKPGDYGDGYFCGLRCAYQFAVVLAEHGRRLAPAARKAET